MPLRPFPFAGLGLPALLLVALVPGQVRAAQSYDNCTGFIDSLPATITSSGTWCLRGDLSTAMTQGVAITLNADDVTLDCNHFKVGGMGAGAATKTAGVYGLNRNYLRVRRCNLRGFLRGIVLAEGKGHRVEDNRLEGITNLGILVESHNGLIARNIVRNTGGSTAVPGSATGIATRHATDVVDNTISGVAALPAPNSNADAWGIEIEAAQHSRVAGNRVRGLVYQGPGGLAAAVRVGPSAALDVTGNELIGADAGGGVACQIGSNARVSNNLLNGFVHAISLCDDEGGNDIGF